MRDADGDMKILIGLRCYLSVYVILKSKINIVPCFVNVEWTIERCIDELAKILGIQSNSNTYLRIFYNGKIILPLDAKLDSLICNNYNKYYNGMAVVLARVNDNTIKEIDISKYKISDILLIN